MKIETKSWSPLTIHGTPDSTFFVANLNSKNMDQLMAVDNSAAMVEMGTTTANLGTANDGPNTSVEQRSPVSVKATKCNSGRICLVSSCVILIGIIAVVVAGVCLYFLNRDKLCDMNISFACGESDDGSNQGDGTDGITFDEPTIQPTVSPTFVVFPTIGPTLAPTAPTFIVFPTIGPTLAPTASPNTAFAMSFSSISPLVHSPDELSASETQGTPTSPYFASDNIFLLFHSDDLSDQSSFRLLNASVSSLQATFSLVEANLTSVNPFVNDSTIIEQFELTLDILNASVASFAVPFDAVAGNWSFALNTSGVAGIVPVSTVFLTTNTRYGWDPSIAAPFLALSTAQEQLDYFQSLPVLAGENVTLNFTSLLDLPSLSKDWSFLDSVSEEIRAIFFAEIFASLAGDNTLSTTFDDEEDVGRRRLLDLVNWVVVKVAVLYGKRVGCSGRDVLRDARKALGLPEPLTDPVAVHVTTTERPTSHPTAMPSVVKLSYWKRFTNMAGKLKTLIKTKAMDALSHVSYFSHEQTAKEVFNGQQSATLDSNINDIRRRRLDDSTSSNSYYTLHCGNVNPLVLARESQSLSFHSTSAVAAHFPDEVELISDAWTMIKATLDILPEDVRDWLNLGEMESYFDAMFAEPVKSMFALQDSQVNEIVSNVRICTSAHESKVFCDCDLPQVKAALASEGEVAITMTVTYTPVAEDETYTGYAYGILNAMPTVKPTVRPSMAPFEMPSVTPTLHPTVKPTTTQPSSLAPSFLPTPKPPITCHTTGSFWHWNDQNWFRIWSCGFPYRYCHYDGEPDGCYHDQATEPGVYGCLRIIDNASGTYSCDGGMTERRALMQMESDDIWFFDITCDCTTSNY